MLGFEPQLSVKTSRRLISLNIRPRPKKYHMQNYLTIRKQRLITTYMPLISI